MMETDAVKPTYVYGLVRADTTLPDGLAGLGPSGRVTTIVHGHLAAIVSDVPVGRPLGVRGDLVAHETVLDAVAGRAAVVPMRFPAVVEEHAVVDELLAPNEDRFLTLLDGLENRIQFTLTGRYEQDAVLREIPRGIRRSRRCGRRSDRCPRMRPTITGCGWASWWSKPWRTAGTSRRQRSSTGSNRSR